MTGVATAGPAWGRTGYEIDILVHGFPGKSVCHGSLGWSSIVLLRGHGHVALVDVGAFGMRRTLIERLAERGLKPADVTDVLLTHSHYDHSINWTLFSHARIVIGGDEIDWSVGVPWGETPVPELYVRELRRWPTLHRAADGDEVLPGVTAHLTPGHTPGHLVYLLRGETRDVVFTGDAAKNRAELLTRGADMSLDDGHRGASFDRIWTWWAARPGSVLVPGHDLPMVQDAGTVRYVAERDAAIRAWYDDTLEKTTIVSLVVR